jgi:hypothetical protein
MTVGGTNPMYVVPMKQIRNGRCKGRYRLPIKNLLCLCGIENDGSDVIFGYWNNFGMTVNAKMFADQVEDLFD